MSIETSIGSSVNDLADVEALAPALIRTPSGAVRFFALQSDELEGEWRIRVMPHLERIQKAYRVPMVDLLCELSHSRSQLWLACDTEHVRGVLLTRVDLIGSGKTCRVWASVGIFKSRTQALTVIRGAMAEIEGWARGIGCSSMEVEGRPVLTRALHGYLLAEGVWQRPLTVSH